MPTYDDLFESEFGTHIDGTVYEDDLHWVVSNLVKMYLSIRSPSQKRKKKKINMEKFQSLQT